MTWTLRTEHGVVAWGSDGLTGPAEVLDLATALVDDGGEFSASEVGPVMAPSLSGEEAAWFTVRYACILFEVEAEPVGPHPVLPWEAGVLY